MHQIKRNVGRAELCLGEELIGSGILLTLTGGKSHIGAVAMGIYDNTSNRASSSVLTAPGHRDHELALYGAQRVSAATKNTVVFVVGIHLDNISKDEILQIVQASEAMIEKYIDKRGN